MSTGANPSDDGNGVPAGQGASPRFVFVSLAQGLYYLATGLWSLVGIGSFQAVTGPKTDLWLVKTVGALVGVIGAAVGLAGWRRRDSPEIALLAAGSAAGLAGIDAVYVARRRISPIYLLDAAAEAALVALWIAAWPRRGRRAER